MSYQVLARKWRPKRFAELVGQEHVVRALTNALDTGRVHHAFLFTGTRGVGKTTIARIFAKSLNCERGASSDPCGECGVCREIDAGRFVDLLEIDAASNTGVDDVREVIENAQYSPARGRYKVYLVDEVHMLSKNAFNALLKTLEEPPPHVKFLLATTDPQKLPVTVLSRCLKFNLKRLLSEQIGGQMRHILDAEGIAYEAGAIAELARSADGSLRDGLSLLDQAIAYGAGSVRAAEVRTMLGTIERAQVARLLEAVHAGDGAAMVAEIAQLAEFAPDFGTVLDEVATLLHRVQLKQIVPDHVEADPELDAAAGALARKLGPEEVHLYYQLAISGRRDLPLAPTPRAGFEMALLRLLAFRPARDEAGGSGVGSGGTRAAAAPSRGGVSAASESAPRTYADAPRPAPALHVAEPVPAYAPVAPAASRTDAEPRPAAAPAAPVHAAPVHAAPAHAAASGPLVIGDWDALIARAELRGPVGQFARNAAFVGVDGDVLRLSLSPEGEALNSPSFVATMEQRLSTALGRAVRVRFEAADAGHDTPAERAARARSEQQADAERAMETDPVVQALMRDMGARIVPNSIKPN